MARDFSGSGQYITVADAASLSFGDGSTDNPMSVYARLKLDDATRFRIVNKWDNAGALTGYEYFWTYGADDKIVFRVYDSSTLGYKGKRASAADTGLQGSWIDVGATYDGSGLESGITMYLNGVARSVASNSAGSYTAMEDTGVLVDVGRITSTTTTYANGKFAEIRIYDRELTAAEFAELHSGKQNTVLKGLVAWHRYNGANDMVDRSGSGNDGTNNSTTLTSDRPAVNWS